MPPPSFRGHETHIRKPPALFGVVVTWLLLQVITTFVRYQEIRHSVSGPLAFILIATELFQPFLGQLHAGPLPVPAVCPCLPGDNGMARCGILWGRILQGLNLMGNFLAQNGESKFFDDCRLGPRLTVRAQCWRQADDPQRFMYPLDALVLQKGHRYPRHLDSNGMQEQVQRDTVKAAYCYITIPGNIWVVVELPGPDGGVLLFEPVRLLLLDLKVRDLLLGLVFFHAVYYVFHRPLFFSLGVGFLKLSIC